MFVPVGGRALKGKRAGAICIEFSRLVSGTYFPIIRVDSWRDRQWEYRLDERVAMYILAGMYILIMCAAMVSLLAIALLCKCAFLKHHVVTAIVAGHAILRALYFLLVATEVFGPEDTVAQKVEYVLFELPLFLLFTVFSWNIFMWALLIAQNAKTTIFFPLWMSSNGAMYAIFVVFVVLVEVLPRDEGESCGGRRAAVEDTTNPDTVNVVYKVFLVVVALGMAGAFLLLGTRMYLKLSKSRATSSPVVIRRIFSVTVTCGVSFAALSVFLLVVLLTGVESVWAGCVCLAIIEVLPLSVVLWLLKPSLPKDFTASLGSRSRGSRNSSSQNSTGGGRGK